MLEVISATEARHNFLPLLDNIKTKNCRYMVTRHGRPSAVILSYEDYSRIEATLKLAGNPKLSHDTAEGLENEIKGQIKPFE